MLRFTSFQPLFPVLLFGMLSFSGCVPGDGTAVADSADKERTESEGASASAKKHPANRLAKESSPYLLLHAHNPVDWYPWGPEAFARAKKENKPIFLSVGYSSCYWCHVMERKVFENEEIAKYMNEHFVNVKVDREERPDVDDVYMTALQMYFQLIGSRQGAGWPLSMFLTPEGKPFAGGTYFPPKDEDGRTGFPSVLKRVHELWKNKEKSIRENAQSLTDVVRRTMRPRPVLKPVKLERKLVSDVTAALMETYDTEYGGIDYRPGRANASKFPVPAKLALLQYAAGKQGDKRAAKALYHTLDGIAAGGIHDHLGGGFHRYSTDRYWHVPHFEKMLYDQAQLAEVYVRAWRATRKATYKEAAEGAFRFVLRDMTAPQGGFYSALDAETEGVEGEYYVWSAAGIEQALGKRDAKLFQTVYGFDDEKRFERGYVLHLARPLTELARQLKVPLPELKTRLGGMRGKLLAVRRKRKPLLRDDKVLTSWNGLMIRALAEAGRVLKKPEYTTAAEKAALFVLSNLRDKKGRLRRSWRKGQAKLNAYLDDYAFLVSGLLALHRATGERKWLNAARRLTDDQVRDYWSTTGGGFFFTPNHHEELIARTRNAYDAVLPSGNAVSARNLVALAERTGVAKYRQLAKETIQAFGSNLENAPGGTAHLALALAEYLDARPTKKPGAGQRTGADSSQTAPQKPGGSPQPAGRTAAGQADAIVKAAVYLSVDKLPAGGKCRVVVLLDVKRGWHVNANPPRPKTAIPTVVSLKSKAGVKLTDVKYPRGRKFDLPGLDEALTVYEGRVAIYGTLEVPKPVPGGSAFDELEVSVRSQACNQNRCLPPRTVKLSARVPLAGPGEPVKSINGKLFSKRPSEKR